MCVYQVWAVPKEARSECLIISDWDSRQLWATLWVLGFELGSSGRSTSALNHWSVSSTSSQLALSSAFHRSFLGPTSIIYDGLLAFYPISVNSLNFSPQVISRGYFDIFSLRRPFFWYHFSYPLFIVCDQMPNRNKLQEKKVIWAHGFSFSGQEDMAGKLNGSMWQRLFTSWWMMKHMVRQNGHR